MPMMWLSWAPFQKYSDSRHHHHQLNKPSHITFIFVNMTWISMPSVIMVKGFQCVERKERDHSENITWGGGFSIFAGEIWVLPEDWQNLGTPLTYNFLITPLHVFYGLISAISGFFYIIIYLTKSGHPPSEDWQNLGAPPPKKGEIWASSLSVICTSECQSPLFCQLPLKWIGISQTCTSNDVTASSGQ